MFFKQFLFGIRFIQASCDFFSLRFEFRYISFTCTFFDFDFFRTATASKRQIVNSFFFTVQSDYLLPF